MKEARERTEAERSRQRAALAAALWVVLIYATIPLVRVFQGWFLARYDRGWIMVGLLAVMAAILGITGLWLVRSTRRTRPLDLLVTIAVAIIAVRRHVDRAWLNRLGRGLKRQCHVFRLKHGQGSVCTRGIRRKNSEIIRLPGLETGQAERVEAFGTFEVT